MKSIQSERKNNMPRKKALRTPENQRQAVERYRGKIKQTSLSMKPEEYELLRAASARYGGQTAFLKQAFFEKIMRDYPDLLENYSQNTPDQPDTSGNASDQPNIFEQAAEIHEDAVSRSAMLGVNAPVSRLPWSEEDNQALIKYRNEGLDVIRQHLSVERTDAAISSRLYQMALELGLPGNEKAWTSEEDEILRNYYPEGGTKAVLDLLPERTLMAIYNRAANLGLRTKTSRGSIPWSKHDIEVLKEKYPEVGPKGVQPLLEQKRSLTSIATKACKLKVRYAEPDFMKKKS